MSIAAFTDHIATPSSRFRIRQYVPLLARRGIAVHDFFRRSSTQTASDQSGRKRIRQSARLMGRAIIHEARNLGQRLHEVLQSRRYDAVWLSRQLVIGYPTFEHLLTRPMLYDVDDAIFHTGALGQLQFRISAQRASAVIAGNRYLATEARKYNANVHVLPTAVDTDRWYPRHANPPMPGSQHDEFRIGWSGTSSSFRFFFPIQRELKRFLKHHPTAKLVMMSDRFPFELEEIAGQVAFSPWTETDEVSFVQSLDVGLMPLEDEPWSRGKCAYKLLLYAACGVPAVVSPIGANEAILSEADLGLAARSASDWSNALHELYINPAQRTDMGRAGVTLVSDRYSVRATLPVIERIFRTYV